MIAVKYYNAALAALSSLSCHPGEGRDPIAQWACAPPPPVDGFPTNYVFPRAKGGDGHGVVKAKCVPLTGFPLKYQGLVKVVTVVKAFTTYRTCARARVCVSLSFFLINIFYNNTKCIDHLDQTNKDAVFPLTICIDHN